MDYGFSHFLKKKNGFFNSENNMTLIIQANNGKKLVILLEMVDFRWLKKNNMQKIDYFSLAIELFWQITQRSTIFQNYKLKLTREILPLFFKVIDSSQSGLDQRLCKF